MTARCEDRGRPRRRFDDVPKLPPRPRDAHKGTFGRALLVGGSRGMSGAISLAGLAALRAGAGLVFLGVPRSIESIVAAHEPSYQVRAIADDNAGRISLESRATLDPLLSMATAVGLGPGLGQSPELVTLVRDLFDECACPMVLDADALNALAGSPELLNDGVPSDAATARPIRVLTPHPGEFARLTGLSSAEVQHQREETACEFADRTGTVLVLKGAHTVVTDGERMAINPTGNSGMATGGTGDVLTGILTALLAQGMDGFDAARLAVYVHGLAGDLASDNLSEIGLMASDLVRYLGPAWKHMLTMR